MHPAGKAAGPSRAGCQSAPHFKDMKWSQEKQTPSPPSAGVETSGLQTSCCASTVPHMLPQHISDGTNFRSVMGKHGLACNATEVGATSRWKQYRAWAGQPSPAMAGHLGGPPEEGRPPAGTPSAAQEVLRRAQALRCPSHAACMSRKAFARLRIPKSKAWEGGFGVWGGGFSAWETAFGWGAGGGGVPL